MASLSFITLISNILSFIKSGLCNSDLNFLFLPINFLESINQSKCICRQLESALLRRLALVNTRGCAVTIIFGTLKFLIILIPLVFKM